MERKNGVKKVTSESIKTKQKEDMGPLHRARPVGVKIIENDTNETKMIDFETDFEAVDVAINKGEGVYIKADGMLGYYPWHRVQKILYSWPTMEEE